jgi:hypothetical protein
MSGDADDLSHFRRADVGGILKISGTVSTRCLPWKSLDGEAADA